jgi:hypothetical protein
MSIEHLEQLNQELIQKLIELEELRQQLKEELLKKQGGILSRYGKIVGGVDTSNFKDASYIYAPYQPLYISPRP